jgi:NADPH:quinone reductase-like Zn-dependent oxidoreductase
MAGARTVLSDYDLVLNSQDPKTLEKSLRVLKSGGQLVSISGPPDPEFARQFGLNPFLKLVMRVLSSGVRKKAKAAAFTIHSSSCKVVITVAE